MSHTTSSTVLSSLVPNSVCQGTSILSLRELHKLALNDSFYQPDWDHGQRFPEALVGPLPKFRSPPVQGGSISLQPYCVQGLTQRPRAAANLVGNYT